MKRRTVSRNTSCSGEKRVRSIMVRVLGACDRVRSIVVHRSTRAEQRSRNGASHKFRLACTFWEETMHAIVTKAGIGLFVSALCALAGCGGGGGGAGGGGGGAGGGGGGGGVNLQTEIDQLFPFTPDQPFDVTFICGRANSKLTYYFDFKPDQTFNVYF